MSDIFQLVLSSRSQVGTAGTGPKGDAGTEGFAELFEQQFQQEPAATLPAPGSESPEGRETGLPEPKDAPATTPEAPEKEPALDFADLEAQVIQAQAAVQAPAVPQAAPQAPAPEAPAPEASAGQAPQGQAEPEAQAPAPAVPSTTAQAVPTVTAPQAPAAPQAASRQGRQERAGSPAAEAPVLEGEAQPLPDVQTPEAIDPAAPVQAEAEALPEEAAPRPQAAPTVRPLPQNLIQAQAAAAALPETQAAALTADPLARIGQFPVPNPALLPGVAPAAGLTPVPTASGEFAGGLTPAGSATTAATASGSAAPAGRAPRAGQAEMIERLVATAKLLSGGKGEKTLVLKLQPPELGRIQVRLQVEDGVVTASVRTESPAARHAILQNLEHLKAAFDEQGLQMGRFDVNVDGQDGTAYQFGEGQGGGRRRQDEEAAALMAGIGLPLREAEKEEAGEALVSDAMAVDVFI